jgi:hypothetical protein
VLDWSQYDYEMSPWIGGGSFDLNMRRFTEECGDNLGLVCQYIAAFYDGDDEAAINLLSRALVGFTSPNGFHNDT